MSVVRGRLYGCPVELALDMIGGKWKTVILARLKRTPMRYGELRRAVPTLADKVLTQRLGELEENGLIERVGINRSMGYVATAKGRSLEPALEALYAWGVMRGKEVGARFREGSGARSWVSGKGGR
jgi:DNA-binding HxlR family transcriptional regulator